MRFTDPHVGSRQFRKEAPESDLREAIDPIPSACVACLLIDELCDALMKVPYLRNALGPGVRYLASDKSPHHWTIPTFGRFSAEHQAALLKKKISLHPGEFGPPPLTNQVSKVFRHLQASAGLFSSLPLLYPLWYTLRIGTQTISKQSDFCFEYVGGFFVFKSNGKLRIIIDARWANARFDRTFLQFSMFSFNTLRQVIDNLCVRTKDGIWYALNIDLRHWFHQIPLADRYRLFFAILMTDQKNERGEYVLLPNASPMGWVASPFGGQSLTWSLVLLQPGNEKPEGIDFGSLSNRTTPFPWLPLSNGGGIFVILDNILVVTPHKPAAVDWMKNIVRNACRFRAKIKTSLPETETDYNTILEKVDAECFHKMEPGSDKSFNFNGVDWYHNRHVVRVKKGEDRVLPNPPPPKTLKQGEQPPLPNITSPTGPWVGTRRQLSSVLGLLNWHRTVHGLKSFEDIPKYEAFRTLYRSLQSDDPDWDSPLAISDPEVLRHLIAAWQLRGSEQFCPARPLFFKPVKVVLAATDAATNEKFASKPLVAAILFEGPHEHVVEEPFRRPDSHIALGELQGILLVVQQAVARNKDVVTSATAGLLIVLATDSMVAKHWLETGMAHNSEALQMLQEIDTLLRRHHARIYAAYVNTNDNLADTPSRVGKTRYELGEESRAGDNARRRTATRKVLQAAEKEAKGMFLKAGDNAGGMIRKVE